MSVWFLVTCSCGPGWHTASFFPLYKLHLAFVWSTGRKCLTFWAILPQIRPFWENFYFCCIAHSFFYGWKEISIPSHYTVSGITCSNWSNPWGQKPHWPWIDYLTSRGICASALTIINSDYLFGVVRTRMALQKKYFVKLFFVILFFITLFLCEYLIQAWWVLSRLFLDGRKLAMLL